MEEEKIKEANRLNSLVKKAINFRQTTRDDEYINNEAHYEGMHWQLADIGGDSPFIVKSDINHLKNAVDIRLGSLAASSYYGILKPLSGDDVNTIENLNILYKNEWYRLNMDTLVEEAVKKGAIFDNGYIEFGFDVDKIVGGTNAKREGVITANIVETSNIYLDPSAEDIDHCDFIIKAMKLTMGELKRKHPNWYKTIKEENITGSAAKNNDTGNIFTARDYTNNQDNMVIVYAIYEKYITEVPLSEEENAETLPVTKIKISYLTDKYILEVNNEYPFDAFPIIPFQWEKIPQTPYGIPLLRGLTIPQKVANLIESSINNIAVHYTIPTWIISDDSGLDVDDVAQLINALGVVWKVTDINTAIKQLEPPKVNTDIIQMGVTFVNYIREYAGVTNVYTGSIGTAGSTAEGTADAIGRATIIDNNPLSQIQDFVERLTRLLIQFMVRYYKGDIVEIREDLDNEKYSFKSIKIDDSFENINYDFDVDLGSRSKTDKNRQYNLMKDIYQLQNQYRDKQPVIKVPDLVKAAQLDNYNEMQLRLDNSSEEALEEKASMVVRLMEIANTATPDGSPLIDAQTLSDGIMDILNDDNDLSTVENIMQTYEDYQQQFTAMKQQLSNNYDMLQQQAPMQEPMIDESQNMEIENRLY